MDRRGLDEPDVPIDAAARIPARGIRRIVEADGDYVVPAKFDKRSQVNAPRSVTVRPAANGLAVEPDFCVRHRAIHIQINFFALVRRWNLQVFAIPTDAPPWKFAGFAGILLFERPLDAPVVRQVQLAPVGVVELHRALRRDRRAIRRRNQLEPVARRIEHAQFANARPFFFRHAGDRDAHKPARAAKRRLVEACRVVILGAVHHGLPGFSVVGNLNLVLISERVFPLDFHRAEPRAFAQIDREPLVRASIGGAPPRVGIAVNRHACRVAFAGFLRRSGDNFEGLARLWQK